MQRVTARKGREEKNNYTNKPTVLRQLRAAILQDASNLVSEQIVHCLLHGSASTVALVNLHGAQEQLVKA